MNNFTNCYDIKNKPIYEGSILKNENTSELWIVVNTANGYELWLVPNSGILKNQSPEYPQYSMGIEDKGDLVCFGSILTEPKTQKFIKKSNFFYSKL